MPATHTTAKRLYYDSPILEFTAQITDIHLVAKESNAPADSAQLWQIALDRTAFYPGGGGQPCDIGLLIATAPSGTTLEIPVERVEEDEAGEVWHYIRKPLTSGTSVSGAVDPERRTDHEQQHSGQHLLSAVFLRELNARTVSFHLGAESSTIDLALPEGMEKLNDEDLRRVEESANRIIYENRVLSAHWVARPLAEQMLARGDLRKLPPLEGPFRIVQMQGIEFNACGGTHVQTTGAIGSILLRRVEKVRQGWRIEFVCGLRAVRSARRDYTLLNETAGKLSVGAPDVPARVDSLLTEVKHASKERQKLLSELADAEAYQLDARFAPGALIDATYEDRDVHFARRLIAGLAAKGRGAVIGVAAGQTGSIFILRPPNATFHAGDLVKSCLKDISPEEGLRGGGTAESAQVLNVRFATVIGRRIVDMVKKLCNLSGEIAP
jgi:alanyl-tRNA synthetase